MLAALIAPALAMRQVVLTGQVARETGRRVDSTGLYLRFEVQDRCDFEVRGPLHPFGWSERDRPCGPWRPLDRDDPERDLAPLPNGRARPLRGVPHAASSHALGAVAVAPLRGLEWTLAPAAGGWLMEAAALGAWLARTEIGGGTTGMLVMAVRSVDLAGVDLEWERPGTPAVRIPDHTVRLDDIAPHAEAWRCAALRALAPGALDPLGPVDRRAAWLAARVCPDATEAHAVPVCRAASAWSVLAPLWHACGEGFRAEHRAAVDARLDELLRRRDLDAALALVEEAEPAMGAEWTGRARLAEVARREVPERAAWARRNGAPDQAKALEARWAWVGW